jgi:predicted HTH transcriptional regulator
MGRRNSTTLEALREPTCSRFLLGKGRRGQQMNAPEYEHIEYKQSMNQWREIIESVAAFATARSGTIRIGIAPDGRRVGIQIGRTTLETLANNIKTNTDPPQYPSISVEGDDASAIIVVHIEESPVKPVWALGSRTNVWGVQINVCLRKKRNV